MLNINWSNQALAWVSRVLAILWVALNGYGWIKESLARQDHTLTFGADWLNQWAVTTHLLPLILLILGLVFGWKQPFYGALAFALFAGLQALSVGTEWEYLPLVVAPPLVVALSFTLGWVLALRRR